MDEHYFSADPAVRFRRQPVHAEVWGRQLSLTSGSGVFAQGRLDVGTAVMFRETEPPSARRYLDLGCGYGVIGLALAVTLPRCTVRAVDVN
jgi:16S rRNA (guanine1207-N2)-methyltransferase